MRNLSCQLHTTILHNLTNRWRIASIFSSLFSYSSFIVSHDENSLGDIVAHLNNEGQENRNNE